MFSQLLFVRLRAAEKALREGRIDEAYRLATAADLKSHARGKVVLAALTEKFIQRARENYRTDKFTEALMDLDRAEAGGCMKAEIEELRGYVRLVAVERHRRDDSRRERIQEAQKRIERGSVAAGKDMLELAAADPTAQAVLKKAAGRAKEAERAVEQAERFLRAGQVSQAAERIKKAKSLDAHCEAALKLETEIISRATESARAAICAGHLKRAQTEVVGLAGLGDETPVVQETSEILSAARQAGDALRRYDYADARRQVMQLCRKLSNAPWIDQALEQLKQLEELQTAACAGPLGEELGSGAMKKVVAGRQKPYAARRLDETVALSPSARPDHGNGLANQSLLLVDGGGSYLLVRGGQASIGRAASEIPADVPIISDLAERHANITRVDEDYFLFSAKDVEVGGQRTQHALLRDGDRVVLGKKAKFTFRLPSRKSSTAVLELSDTTKAPNDVRRVVLLNQHAIIANSPTAHVFCRHAGCSLVLFERNGSLWVRAKSDGHVDTEARQLVLGEPVEVGGAGLVLAPWKSSALKS